MRETQVPEGSRRRGCPLRALAVLVGILIAGAAPAADLVLDNVQDRVIDGGTYDRLIIHDSSNIAVRNATFSISHAASVVEIRDSSYITLENNDIVGDEQACTGISLKRGSYLTIRNNKIHEIADDGFEFSNSHHLTVGGNSIYRLVGYGTDSNPPGPCYNGHSDAIELYNIDDSEFDGNLIFDVRGTSAFYLRNGASSPSSYCQNIRITNNVFMTPESGFVVYLFKTAGLQVYNNTFWWGRYGGVVVGNYVTDMDFENNVVHSVNYNHMNEPHNPSEHRYKNNIVSRTSGQRTPDFFDVGSGNVFELDPGYANIPGVADFGDRSGYRQSDAAELRVKIEDFVPSEASAMLDRTGASLVVTRDALGTPRPQGAGLDLGALERSVAGPPPPARPLPPILLDGE